MSTTAGTGEGFAIGRQRVDDRGTGGTGGMGGMGGMGGSHGQMGGFGPWFRLFLGISGTALAIALALGLVVLLTTTVAHVQPSAAFNAITPGGPARYLVSASRIGRDTASAARQDGFC